MPTTIIANHLGNRAGTWSASTDRRVIGFDGDEILAQGVWDSGPLNTTEGEPSLSVRPLPDGPNGYQVTVKVVLFGGSTELYRINLPDERDVIDLGTIPLPVDDPTAPPGPPSGGGVGSSGVVTSPTEPTGDWSIWFVIDPVTGALLDIRTPD